MNDCLTPDFIKLASHPEIQDIIEPEVGMWFAGWNKEGRWDIELIGNESHVKICQEHRQSTILLPTLSWLVRKLAQLRKYYRDEFYFNGEAWVYRFCNDTNGGFELADTPELACLKALCKLKGIEV